MAKTDISVEELVSRVKRGEIKLPEMQRRYVWTATRVRDLLDSLYRGYPSGSMYRLSRAVGGGTILAKAQISLLIWL